MFSLNKGILLTYFADEKYPFMLIIFLLITMAASYLLGGINSAIIISKVLYKDDIRKHGSGNPGLTNMLRTYGKGAAGLTLLGDVLKCAVSILIAAFFFGFHYIAGTSTHDGYCYMAGLFAVFGHVFPIWYKFKGGKGVLATATMALILAPIPALILILIFAAIVAFSKYVSLGSVSAAVLFPVVLNAHFNLALGAPPSGIIILCTIILAILIVWCHRENLKRISNRTERKISIGGKKKKDDSKDE